LPFRIPISAIAGTIVTLGLFGLAARSHLNSFQCRNVPLAEALSPDGSLRAVSFVRDCGRQAPRSTQLALIGAKEELGNRFGNVFVAELERYGDLQMQWSSPDALEIRIGPLRRAYRADPGLGRIRIRYGRLPE
jgi:hypothetical protein